jgi:hypothetical protein
MPPVPSSIARSAQSGGSGSGGGTPAPAAVETFKVTKHSYDAPSYELLVNASSSNTSARLSVYAQSGAYIGEIQNGGGGKYGGSVFVLLHDPVELTIKSSAGGSITVPTIPFVL